MSRLAALLAAALLLAGCVRIPLGGDVSTVPIADEGDGNDLIVVPEGPVAGASPREILRGFLLAGRGPQNGYEVATEFLTDEFAAQWWPGAGVIVTSSPLQPVGEAEDRLGLTVEAIAELDADGRYLATPPTERELAYEFQLEDGEWRISSAPDGTVLSPSSFDVIFEATTLYFWSPDYRFLVPERRWFLDTRTIANRVVDELLQAASPLVEAGVLATAFPPSTKRSGSVSFAGGLASVTLSSGVLAVDRRTQSLMLAQLDWSLASLGDVEGATIVAGGFPVRIDSIGSIDRLQVAAVPIAVIDGAFGLLDGDSVSPMPEIGSALDSLDLDAVSLSRDGDAAAVLLDSGVAYVSWEGMQLRDERDGLAAPSLDPWGWVWSVPVGDPTGLVAVGPDGVARPLPVDMSGRVVALQISRDGTRVLVATHGPEGTTVVVAGVARDAGLGPISLVDPLVVASGTRLVDAAWASGTEIALLAASGAVTVFELGGRAEPLGSVGDGVQIVGGNGVEGVRVRDSSGRVWRPGGEAGWLEIGHGVELLGVQQ